MTHLPQLLKLMELTRSQVQYGYAISGVYKNELSDLAQHHYLVTFTAWQLARAVNSKGANLNIEKVLEFCLIHDLGELFGSDIAMPYAAVNKKAKTAAKNFESINHAFLSKYFGPDAKHFKKLSAEILNAKSDEALVAKIADYLECANFLIFIKKLKPLDVKMLSERIPRFVKKIKNSIAKNELSAITNDWLKAIRNPKHINETFAETIHDKKA